jgi:hypothetical protein
MSENRRVAHDAWLRGVKNISSKVLWDWLDGFSPLIQYFTPLIDFERMGKDGETQNENRGTCYPLFETFKIYI